MDNDLKWLRLPAVMSSLAEFTRFAHEGAGRASLPESELDKLDLILEELLVNVFRYAYSPGEAGETAVGYSVPSPHVLRVDICDWGRAFNPLEMKDPDLDLPLAQRAVGGLGVYLVKKSADSIRYKRENGTNIVSFSLG